MRKNRFIILTMLIVVLTVIVTGCPNVIQEEKVYIKGSEGGGGSKPAVTVKWETQASGEMRFSTNDARYIGLAGMTYWKLEDTVIPELDTFSIRACKTSGYGSVGYGALFCAQDTGNFLAVSINIDGMFRVWKVQDKVFTGVAPYDKWTASTYLYKNWDSPNIIKVKYNKDNTFTIFFNSDSTGVTFSDKAPFFTGGKNGYHLEVSQHENFPAVPVDVLFREIL